MATTTARQSPTSRAPPCTPNFGENFVFRRVLHTDTAAPELRTLLRDEWATISVVAGLFVLLSGGAATAAPVPSEISDGHSGAAAYYVNLFAGTFAYIGSASSCIVALFLLHTSNTVPEHKLHAFLIKSHSILWIPSGGLLMSIVATSIGNNAATLIIYDNWVVSGVRIGIAVCWLSLLFYTTWSLSHAAQHSAGPRRAESVEEVVAEAGAG